MIARRIVWLLIWASSVPMALAAIWTEQHWQWAATAVLTFVIGIVGYAVSLAPEIEPEPENESLICTCPSWAGNRISAPGCPVHGMFS